MIPSCRTGTEQTLAQMMPGAAPTKHTMVHRCRQSDWFGVNLWTAVIEKAPVSRTLFYERALLSLGYVIRQTSLLLVVMFRVDCPSHWLEEWPFRYVIFSDDFPSSVMFYVGAHHGLLRDTRPD